MQILSINPTLCSSTLQSSFLRLQRAFTPTLIDEKEKKPAGNNVYKK